MQLSAKADYALRALLELAERTEPTTADTLAIAQGIPSTFMAQILNDLRRGGLVTSRRGPGGYRLTRSPAEITVGDIVRLIDGALFEVCGRPPELSYYDGPAGHLRDVWLAVQDNLTSLLQSITLNGILAGQLPAERGDPLLDATRPTTA